MGKEVLGLLHYMLNCVQETNLDLDCILLGVDSLLIFTPQTEEKQANITH